jgi:amino acid adenylation domain-containing protein
MHDLNIEHFRLSPQQKHLWLVQHGDQPEAYLSQCIARLHGDLDPARLSAALDAVVDRHEILRTSLQPVPGMRLPVQVIDTQCAPTLEQRSLDPALSDEQALALLAEISRELATDLEHTLLQAVLASAGGDRHWLLLSVPALRGDATTLQHLLRELVDSYKHSATDEADETVQYADVAEWQNEILESPETEAERAFWLNQDLSPLAAETTLFGRPLRGTNTLVPAVHAIPLDPEQSQALIALAQRWQITAPALLLALWQSLLWRVSDRQSLCVGVAYDGRSYAELEQALGLFERYLPFTTSMDDSTPLIRHAQQVQQQLDELSQVQEYFSWDQTRLERARPDAEPFMPLSFAAYTLAEPSRSAGLRYTIEQIRSCTDRFALKLLVVQREQSLSLELHYDTQALPAAEIERLADCFHALCISAVVAPETALGRLNLLSEGAYRLLIDGFNQTRQPLASGSVLELFAAQVARRPEGLAVVCGDERLSFAELDRRANQLAQHLRRLGVGPDLCVGICLQRSAAMVVGLLGILKAGGAYVPLDPAYPRERLRFMIEDARVPVLLTQSDLAELLPEQKRPLVAIDRDWPAIAQEPDTPPAIELQPDHLAYVIYTSGSTGRPKGVMIHHRGLYNYLTWAGAAYHLTEGAGSLVHSPLGFDLTITGLFAPLCAGQQVTLLPADAGVEALAHALRQGADYSLVKLTPAHLEILNQLLPADELAGRTRAFIIGGEALLAQTLTGWRRSAPATRLINEYGPTETVVGCCVYEVQPDDPDHGPVLIGTPIANTRLYVLDRFFQPVPVGVTGELYIGGDGVARGYLDRPELTAERFMPDPFGVAPSARLYRSGDLARYRADGQLEYLGRADQQIKLRGFRIELGEIEAALARHADVREAVVLLRDDGADQRLVGYVVPRAGVDPAHLDSNELRRFVGDYLPEYMLPTAIVALERFPLTANGKVDRQALPAPSQRQRFVAPATIEEEILAGIWSRVLEIAQVGVEDSFFALGGNSIRSIQVVAQAQERGLHFSVEEMFTHPTIRELARQLQTKRAMAQPRPEQQPFSLIRAEDRALLADEIEDAYPIARLQGGMIFHNQSNRDQALYHDIFSYHLKLPIDLALLQAVVDDLVARHPALRTSFDLTTFSEPLQLVHRGGVNLLSVADIRELTPEQQDEMIARWIADEKQRGFDCAALPLVRFQVHLRSEQTLQFSLSFHHAVIDGWSDAIMLTELFTDYFQRLKGQATPIPSPSASYRDFVALEREAIESEEARRFWDTLLSDATLMRLPRWPEAAAANKPGVAVVQPVPIPVELSLQLKRLALELAVPIKNVLLAAHLHVIAMLTGQTDVLTSMVSSGRPETIDGERVLGLFINSIPLRLDLAGSTWAELITRAFEAERASLPFRRYPTIELQRRHGGQPLSESLFYFTHYHIFQSFQQMGDVELLDVLPYEISSFPLVANFRVDPFTTEINLSLTCDGTILCWQQIESIAGYYAATLSAMATAAHERSGAAALLGQQELQQQLVAFNPGAYAPPAQRLIHEWIAEQAARTPDATAVIAPNERVSYRELDSRANRLAHVLQARGVGPEERIGICMQRSAELIVAILAVLKAGAAYVPLDPEYPAERLRLIADNAGLALLLTHAAAAELIAGLPLPALLVDRDASMELPAEPPAPLGDSDNAAYVIYTSGSTGQPKGVVVSHANLLHSTQARVLAYRDAPTCFLLLSSVAFDSSIAGIFWTLCQGAALLLPSDQDRRDLGALIELIAREQVSHTLCIPSFYALLLEQATAEDLASLKAVIVAGEACPGELVERHRAQLPGAALFNEYGPTEASVWATVYDCAQLQPGRPVPIGAPIPYARAYVLDANLRPLPLGVAGELMIGGSGIARGYLEQPALTAERFIPDSLSLTPGARMYRTGDRARWLPDGTLEFLGRVDQQVKIRGFRIEPGEIAALLRRHLAVQDALVVAHDDGQGNKRLVAYIVPSQPADVSTVTVDESDVSPTFA